MEGVDLSDRQVTTYACPLKSNCVVLRNIFIKNYLLELSITNTKILMAKCSETGS